MALTFNSVTETPCTCGWLEKCADDPDWPIEYDASLNEFHIIMKGSDGQPAQGMIYHCFWCGGAAPKSKREEKFLTVGIGEDCRLRSLLRSYTTFEQALSGLGQPDQDWADGASSTFDNKTTSYRCVLYEKLSSTADVRLVDYPGKQFGIEICGKYIGPLTPET